MPMARQVPLVKLLPLVFVVVWCVIQFLLWYVLDHHHQQQQQQQQQHSSSSTARAHTLLSPAAAASPPASNINHTATTNFHIVFSTDCSGYQHWQGIFLYYSARRVRQPGIITRIASGCTPEQQISIQKEWERIDPTKSKFMVHFAPSTALHPDTDNNNNDATTRKQQTYKYSNKPGGILHWLENRQPQLDDDQNTVVCLLDPDMILLKPITPDLLVSNWKRRPRGKNQVEYVDEKGIPQLLRIRALEQQHVPRRVSTGHPAGQHFGIGGAWVQGMISGARPAWKNFSKAFACGEGSPCTTTSAWDAKHKYAVGPVYLATVSDWKRIAKTWSDYVPKVHRMYPHLLAEMYSFTMAVANLELPFNLFSSYMITGSDVSSSTEAWSWVDDIIIQKQEQSSINDNKKSPIAEQHICSGVDTTTTPDWTHDSQSLSLPNTLHYCQRYKLDTTGDKNNSFLFAKRKIPHDVFSCQQQGSLTSNPVPFDPHTLIKDASKKSEWSTTDRRTLFALCHLVPLLNWARKVFREEACSG